MTDTALVEVTQQEVIAFLEQGFRNVEMPYLGPADLSDVAGALESFARRIAHQSPTSVSREAILAMEDFLNEPRRGGPQPEPIDTRDYRHEAYRIWEPICRELVRLLSLSEKKS